MRFNHRRQYRTVVVGERPLLRSGLCRLIDEADAFSVAAECGSTGDAARAVAEARPDAAVVDLWSDGLAGLDTLGTLRAAAPRVPVLVVSAFSRAALAARVLRSGASGFITADADRDELLEAIRVVADGRRYLPVSMQSAVMDHLLSGGEGEGVSDLLTERELQVFALAGEGRSSEQIGGRLGISEKTVHTHRENIKRKLGLDTAARLVHNATLWVTTLRREPT